MKKTVLLLLLNIFLFLTVKSIYGQDSTKVKTNQNYKYGIGFGAGYTTGYGISFKYLPNRFGAQINFAPFKNNTTEKYSAGLTFIYTLIEAKKN